MEAVAAAVETPQAAPAKPTKAAPKATAPQPPTVNLAVPIEDAALAEFCTFHENYVSRNIQLADAKAGLALVAFSGSIVLALKDDGYRGAIRASLLAAWHISGTLSGTSLLGWLALLLCAAGTALAFWVIIPRLDGEPLGSGIIYWGDVARRANAKTYADEIRRAPVSKVLDDRLQNLFYLSRICRRKMWLLIRSMWLGAAGVVLTMSWIIVFSTNVGD